MKISVVIPAYNEEKYLAESVKAILAQDYPDFEVIVVDNASTDRTGEIARSFPIRVVLEKQKGTSAARERGRRESSGDIIVTMDADCLPEKDWLSKGARHFLRKDVVAVAGPYDYYDAGFIPRRLSLYFQKWMITLINSFLQVIKRGAMSIGGNCFMRASTLEAINGFDPSYTFYGDDTDIATRLSRKGRVVFDPCLIMKTSSRRFHKQGFFHQSWLYFYSCFRTLFPFKRKASQPSVIALPRYKPVQTGRISIIIPVYNEENYIGQALKAVLAQDYDDFEVIVIDNASTDRTAEVVRSFPQVRLVSESRKGTMWACERGRKEATGEIIVRTDADCLPGKDWLSKGAAFFTNLQVVAISGPCRYYGCSAAFSMFVSMVQIGIFAPLNVFLRFFKIPGGVALGGNIFIRASALETIGGFNTKLAFYGDDTDTVKRLSRAGRIVFSWKITTRTSARRFKEEGMFRLGLRYVGHFFKVLFSK